MAFANKILQGDCIKQLKTIPDAKIDLAFADPPFNIGYKYDVYDDRREAEEYLEWSRTWITETARTLKPNGTFWLAIGDEFAAELKLLAQREANLFCRSWVIWYYTFGVNCKKGFSRSHTHLFHFTKHKRKFTFNSENPQVRIPSARQLVYGDSRANPRGRLPDNTWILRPQDAPTAFQPTHDTWYYPRVAGTFKEREGFHGCQMPEQLLGRIIRLCSNPGDCVLDPFGGSGTTLATAKKLGRDWVGIELSKEYTKHIKTRLKQAKFGQELDGAADPLASAPATHQGKNVNSRSLKTAQRDQEELQSHVLAAFKKTRKKSSANWVLTDPERNLEFTSACQKLGAKGVPEQWNELLWQLDVTDQLSTPKKTKSPSPFSDQEIDQVADAAELAFHTLQVDLQLSLKKIFFRREQAEKFDQLAESYAPGFQPFLYRWAAWHCIPGQGATDSAPALHHSEEPITLTSDNLTKRKFHESELERLEETEGAYSLFNKSDCLYVGSTLNLKRRLNRIQTVEAWQKLNITRFQFFAAPNQASQLQSFLIKELAPRFNTLMPASERQLELFEA